MVFSTAARSALNCTPPASSGGSKEQLFGPSQGTSYAIWLQQLHDFRDRCLASVGYNGSIYNVDALKWTQTTYMQPQMHPYDRFFYDPVLGNYTVKKWLKDLDDRYGGIDSALIWPTCAFSVRY